MLDPDYIAKRRVLALIDAEVKRRGCDVPTGCQCSNRESGADTADLGAPPK